MVISINQIFDFPTPTAPLYRLLHFACASYVRDMLRRFLVIRKNHSEFSCLLHFLTSLVLDSRSSQRQYLKLSLASIQQIKWSLKKRYDQKIADKSFKNSHKSKLHIFIIFLVFFFLFQTFLVYIRKK